MRTEVIPADSIDAAVERILNQLKEDTSTRGSRRGENVIYFDGWDGLCASAVLRTVAAEAPATLQFDQVFHVDCSNWVNRRTLQRSIAEHLELPPLVMDMFRMQDEEDDFNGVPLDSRDAVPQVHEVMLSRWEQKLNSRFLVIFHNGSDYEIDLASFCGLPLYGYSRNTVLWTFQGRFRLKPRTKVDGSIRSTDVVLSATHHDIDPQELWSYLVLQEAADLRVLATCKSNNSPTGSFVDDQPPAQIAECFLYMWKLCGMVHNLRTDYDLATHCCNYWLCDNNDDDVDDGGPWRDAHALKREMRLDADYYNHNLYQFLSSHMGRCAESMARLPHWTSPTLLCSYTGTVQFFPSGDMFQYFTKVRVLKLSHCTFNFSASPFLRCHNLRFLWLDHCEDQESKGTSNGEVTMEDIHRFFQRLWVLDVRYTCCRWILSAQVLELMTHLQELIVIGVEDWDMSHFQRRLPNVHKVRIKKSIVQCSGSSSENNDSLFSWMTKKKIELLEFSGNRVTNKSMRSFTIAVVNNSLQLETVIIDEGCLGVEQISFRRCTNLKNVLLRGLFKGLESIDISGTAVKTLDLSEVEAKELDELVALGCGKLCAILWPPKEKIKNYLMKLRIGTTIEDSTNATSSLTVQYGSRAPTEYAWYVSVSDARLLRSLVAVKKFGSRVGVHMEISTPGVADTGGSKEERSIFDSGPVNQQKRQEQPEPEISSGGASVVYADVSAATQNTDQAITHKWTEPCAPFMDANCCYMYIQDDQQDAISSWTITVPDMICDVTHILHVHDSRSLTCVPGPLEGSKWTYLWWCRVERCPSLDCVFFVCPQAITRSDNYVKIFYFLHTLWCSQLPKVRCIWDFSGLVSSKQPRIDEGSFCWMSFMHVDMCPRLTHVLPLSAAINNSMFRNRLEILEIVWCGDTRALFPLEEEVTTTTIEFPRLRRIHLRELPQLQGICGRGRRIYTPNLQSIQIRGCWSLTRLPALGDYNKKKVECDCEKEWWDKLKWDGIDAKHHPSLYKPTHPRYYKKTTQLRTSVLR